MQDSFSNTTDEELKEIWRNKNNPKYTKEFVNQVQQELEERELIPSCTLKNGDQFPIVALVLVVVSSVIYGLKLGYDLVKDVYHGPSNVDRFKEPIDYWIGISLESLREVFLIGVVILGFLFLIDKWSKK
jgi:hypothetical protein